MHMQVYESCGYGYLHVMYLLFEEVCIYMCICNYFAILNANRVDTHHRKGGRPHRPDFTARTLTALHGIVELDWKREMEKERQQLVCSHEPDLFISTMHLILKHALLKMKGLMKWVYTAPGM